jgi:hypothetical protein
MGIDLRISIIKTRIEEMKREVTTYKRYLNRGLNDRWMKHVIATIQKKIRKRTVQLNRYLARRARWKREGKI